MHVYGLGLLGVVRDANVDCEQLALDVADTWDCW